MNQTPQSIPERIVALHGWYAQNVMPWPLTPEVERSWHEYFKQGFNGPQFAKVIRYLRSEIRAGRRNAGALALRNLLAFGPDGVLENFVKDLGLCSVKLAGKLAPSPESDPEPAPKAPAKEEPMTDLERAQVKADLEELKRKVRRGDL